MCQSSKFCVCRTFRRPSSLEIFVRNLRSMIAVSSQPRYRPSAQRRLQHWSSAAEAGSSKVEKNDVFLSLRVLKAEKQPRQVWICLVAGSRLFPCCSVRVYSEKRYLPKEYIFSCKVAGKRRTFVELEFVTQLRQWEGTSFRK